MAGYTRQDTNDNIATGKVINASDFDNEYNAIQTAFNASTGHKHDGTAAEGARITVIGPAGKFNTDANAFFPTNTATVGLGKTSFVFKDLHIDNIVADGNTISTITSGNLIVDPYTYKLEVKGGTTGGSTSGMIQLNCENNSHGQTIQAQPHSAGVTNKMLLPAGADSTLVSLVSTDTLTNKTLTTATLTTPVFSGISTTGSGNLQVKPATSILEVQGDGSSVEGQIKLNCHVNSHGQTIKAQPHSESVTNTMLLPKGANSTLVSLVSTDTLTNKTLTSPIITTPQINDTSADHQYVFAVSELAADRTVTLPLLGGDDEFVFKDHTQTLTNKTLTSPVLNTGVSGTAVKDEDNMASNSATHLATQQSIKAYVDAEISGITADITEVTAGTGLTGGGASGAVTLNVVGGTGITANANDIAIDSTVATLTGTQTLTNKTLTTPQIQYLHSLTSDNRVIALSSSSGSNASESFLEVKSGGTSVEPVTLTAKATGSSPEAGGIVFHDDVASTTEQSAANFLQYMLPKAYGYIERINNSGSFNNITASSHTINLDTGAVHLLQLANNTISLTLSKQPSTTDFGADSSFGFTLVIKQDSSGNRAVTYPSSVKWAGGTAPTLTGTANSIDVFTFITYDQGTTYNGFTAGLNVS